MAKKKTGYSDRVLKKDPCAYCGNAGGTLDHIHPRSRFGINGWLNYTGSCQLCNSRKGSRSVLEFLMGMNWGRQAKKKVLLRNYNEALRQRDEEDAQQLYHPLHTLLGLNYYTGLPLSPEDSVTIETRRPDLRTHALSGDLDSIEKLIEMPNGQKLNEPVFDQLGYTRVMKLHETYAYTPPKWVERHLTKRRDKATRSLFENARNGDAKALEDLANKTRTSGKRDIQILDESGYTRLVKLPYTTPEWVKERMKLGN